jgi:SAM-dependent methyltransferase
MNYKKLQKVPLLGWMYSLSIMPRARKKVNVLKPLLSPKDKILDIGSGNGGLVLALRNLGYDVTASDVDDLSFYPEVNSVIFESPTLPFADKSFDVAMFVTVLHHAPASHHQDLLKEAKRVAKTVIVMEDVFNGTVQKHFTFLMDSLVNLEFVGHPHSNRSPREWEGLFKEMGFEIQSRAEKKVLGYFDQILFSLKSMP